MRLWDAETGREIYTFEKHTASAFGVAFSPDSRWLASGWGDGMVRIWDTRDPAGKARELPGHSGRVSRVLFLPIRTRSRALIVAAVLRERRNDERQHKSCGT